jgi:hypothetical protein
MMLVCCHEQNKNEFKFKNHQTVFELILEVKKFYQIHGEYGLQFKNKFLDEWKQISKLKLENQNLILEKKPNERIIIHEIESYKQLGLQSTLNLQILNQSSKYFSGIQCLMFFNEKKFIYESKFDLKGEEKKKISIEHFVDCNIKTIPRVYTIKLVTPLNQEIYCGSFKNQISLQFF